MPRSIHPESRFMVVRSWRRGDRGVTATGYQVFLRGDANTPELFRDHEFTKNLALYTPKGQIGWHVNCNSIF